MDKIHYQSGFNQFFSTEAVPGSLPKNQFSPQHCPMGLYAEQISGTAFTALRHEHRKTWCYRIRPSVTRSGEHRCVQQPHLVAPEHNQTLPPPTQMRWNPLPLTQQSTHFIQSWYTTVTTGCIASHQGASIHHYAINASMEDCYAYNADAELLLIPWQGELLILTELGKIHLSVGEIALIPRGICFQVQLLTPSAQGYLCENYGLPFRLPERGPIGANALAEERHFLHPTAHYELQTGPLTLFCKFMGQLWETQIDHSPLDVVAWCGNYSPCKYDLKLFNTMGSVSWDHPDPSIFTVLTSPSAHLGTANVDFVIFPSRWMVSEHSFRPPYYHKNIMSEYMGLIYGEYDAKTEGFSPGGSSLHNTMSPHGVDKLAYDKAIQQNLGPEKYPDTLAFMLESSHFWRPTQQALEANHRQKDYLHCWQGLEAHFIP